MEVSDPPSLSISELSLIHGHVSGGWGDKLLTDGYLHDAINKNQTSVATLDLAVRRTLMQKMKAGVFDPLENQEQTSTRTSS